MTTQTALREPLAAGEQQALPVAVIAARPTPLWKRTIDIAAAAAGLLALLPFLTLAAIAISIDSRGGPIYRQERIGRGGRVFRCWKFRTMRRDAESERATLLLEGLNQAHGAIFKIRDDPRVTRVGRVLRKTSIDELPQLWNVLRGDMSLVGPRPLPLADIAGDEARHSGRLAVAPGLTGLWQVTARRNGHDIDEMVALDIEYANRVSFWLDLKILLLTIPTVLFGRGSY